LVSFISNWAFCR